MIAPRAGRSARAQGRLPLLVALAIILIGALYHIGLLQEKVAANDGQLVTPSSGVRTAAAASGPTSTKAEGKHSDSGQLTTLPGSTAHADRETPSAISIQKNIEELSQQLSDFSVQFPQLKESLRAAEGNLSRAAEQMDERAARLQFTLESFVRKGGVRLASPQTKVLLSCRTITISLLPITMWMVLILIPSCKIVRTPTFCGMVPLLTAWTWTEPPPPPPLSLGA